MTRMTRLSLTVLGCAILAGAFSPTTRAQDKLPLQNSDTQERILVNKVANDISDAKDWLKYKHLSDGEHRWDVTVFKYPSDGGKHYIKRLIGLPAAASVFDTIKVQGATIEITRDAIRIEGGSVEILRTVSPK